jgi:hypothetical protein
MRTLLVVIAAILTPVSAAAQIAPRSVSLEFGISRQIGSEDLLRAPVALAASWWIADALDFTVRAGWASAPRTDVRGADSSFEVGAGLRRTFPSGALRPSLFADLGAGYRAAELGARTRGGAALDAVVARDVVLGVGAGLGAFVPVAGGSALLDVAIAIHAEAFF